MEKNAACIQRHEFSPAAITGLRPERHVSPPRNSWSVRSVLHA